MKSIITFLIVILFIKVSAQPGWVAESGNQFTMGIHAKVEINGTLLSSTGSQLGAFKDGKCWGVCTIFNGPAGMQFQLSVGYIVESATNFELKVWNASTNEILNVNEKFNFQNDGGLGTIAVPIKYTVTSTCNLSILPESFDFTNTAGNNTVSITSNSSWTVSDNASWITVSPASGSNNGTLTVSVSANSGSQRSGTVKITGCNTTKEIIVTQTSSSSCTSPMAKVNNPRGVAPLTFTCSTLGGSGGNIAYKWYKGTSCAGTVIGTSQTLTVNESGYFSCKAYIEGNESTCFDCGTGEAKIESQMCTNWTTTPGTQNVPVSGGKFEFQVSATGGTCSYNANSNDSWIHSVNYIGGGYWEYTVDANNTGNTRTGSISVNDLQDGIYDITRLTVTQAGPTISTPLITVSSNSLLSFGNVQINTSSSAQSFTVSGSNLKADISLSAPTGFEISKSSGSGYQSSLNLAQSGGTVSNTTIYVRFKPTTTGTKSGNIAITSTGAETKNVAVSGTGTSTPPPAITVSTTSLPNFGNVLINSNSTAQNFTVSGSNLKADISLSAPTGFEISKSSGSGYQSSLNLTQSGGTVSNTTIYVRFKPTTTGIKSGNIAISSTGAETKNVAVSGTGEETCTPPVSPVSATASQTAITSGQSTTLQVNGGALNSASNWVWYTGNCGGSQVGTGTSLSVSPTSTTTYYVQATACGNTSLCRSVTITVLPSSGCNPPASQSGIIFSDVNANAITVNTTGGNGNRRIIMINTVNSFTIPEIGTEPSANSIYSGSGEQVVYFGAANNVTVTGLKSGVRYWVRVFEANCKGESTVYNASTLDDNPSSISTICNSPVSPLKAEANPVNIFSGETTTLQVIGGSLNAAPDWEWYSGSCNGVLVGKGASISVSPATTTTYFVRASACGVNTICREVTVTVNDENSVIDADGNVYSIVTIGNQTWLGQNLKTTKYNSGTSIPLVTNNNTWSNLSGPAYCWYNNDISYKNPFGALYNWYAVNTGKLCPVGWHVPTYYEWKNLENYLITNGYNYDGSTSENKIAKSLASNDGWLNSLNVGSPGNTDYSSKTNTSNFSAYAAGGRIGNGSFDLMGYKGDWWSSTPFFDDNNYVWGYDIYYYEANTSIGGYWKTLGTSVRCICDYPVGNKSLKTTEFVKIYPNPASKEIFIECLNSSSITNCTIEIYDMEGKKVKTRNNIDILNKQTINTSDLISGFYFIRIYSDELILNQKIVIKQE